MSAVWGPAEACTVPGCAGGVASNPTIVGDAVTGHLFIFFSWLSANSQHSTHHGTGRHTFVVPPPALRGGADVATQLWPG